MKKAEHSTKNKKGFTLIELMIVIAIIGILTAIAIPKFGDMVRKAKEAKTKGNLGALRGAINIYYADNGGSFPCPAGISGLDCLVSEYIKEIPLAYMPTYHDASNAVREGNGRDENWAIGAGTPEESGGWYYYFVCPPLSACTLDREIVVNCAHTDIKGEFWYIR
jgi:prepilin-type N-terminal cleavage/methylation domain-containing protein